MIERFEVITAVCHGKDNEMIDELESHVKQSLVYDPTGEKWLLGEWVEVDEDQ